VVDSAVDPLDLYAKVEDLLGVKEAAPSLYAHYLLFLKSIEFETLLDVGCGSGDFLRQMHGVLNKKQVKGIDLSPLMVTKTVEQGFDAECKNLCDVEGKYDVLTAVFDMMNYLDKAHLKDFFMCAREHLNEDGFFLCDINTLYAFENVAVGAYVIDDDERFLSIDSDFENDEYSAEFTLFEKEGAVFKKSQETIKQYYHTIGDVVMLSGMELIQSDEVNLYDFDKSDKAFLVLKKSS
jgi:predicted TPR repeat methyltransferase